MKLLRALLCKLSKHHWTLWLSDSRMSYRLDYVCARCGTRRNIP